MIEILKIVKIIAFVLLILIVFFVLLVFLAKYYFIYRQKQEIKKRNFIWNIFNSHFSEYPGPFTSDKSADSASPHPPFGRLLPMSGEKEKMREVLWEQKPLHTERIKILKKSIPQMLMILDDFEKTHRNGPYWEAFIAQLSDSILKPVARKWAFSYHWIKRFYATRCYAYGFDAEDKEQILTILRDKTLLNSINMASVVVKKQDPFLINEMITVFSTGRHLQQTSFAEILMQDHPDISNILKERLESETDSYVKIFCYRLLSKMPEPEIIPIALKDIDTDSIDLKISALDYLIHSKTQVTEELISKLVTDINWEVRASVAKVLGDFSGEKSLGQLNSLIKDEAWWVRTNAANSLSKRGKSGLDILKNIKPEEDKFAYESAQSILRAKEE